MSKQERRANVQAIAARYAVAGRSQKSIMLDEYCATAKVGRKYAIAQMGRASQALADEAAGIVPRQRRRTGRCPVYAADAALFSAIATIWEAAKRPCAKRLVALLPLWLPHYEIECGEHTVSLSRTTKRLAKRISAASIDRLLSATRQAHVGAPTRVLGYHARQRVATRAGAHSHPPSRR